MSAFYLLRRHFLGNGFTADDGLGDVISFLSNNALAIKNNAGAVSAGVEAGAKGSITTANII